MSEENSGDISLDAAVTGTGSEKSRSSSGGSGSGGSSRETIVVSCQYGTEMFVPDTVCEVCSSTAEGVLVCGDELFGSEPGIETGRPLCKDHRRELEAMNRFSLDGYKYKTFK